MANQSTTFTSNKKIKSLAEKVYFSPRYSALAMPAGDFFRGCPMSDPRLADIIRTGKRLDVRIEQGYSWKILAIFLGVVFFWLVLFCVVRAEEINLDKIAQIESSGNPLAYNSREGSTGLFQISPICLKEWNNFHPKDQYARVDLWDENVNTKIADWYINVRIPEMLKHYRIPITTLNIIASYNWGIGNVGKWQKNGAKIDSLPKITQKYYQKYTGIKYGDL